MEGVRHRPTIRSAYQGLALALTLLTGLVLLADPAQARRRYTTDAKSGSRGVDFSIKSVKSNGEASSIGVGGVTCSYELQFGNIGTYSSYWKNSPADTTLARKTCSDGTDEFVWVYIGDSESAPTIDPETLAQEVRDQLPVPGLEISSNPRRGLAGLKSWFWLEDGGQPLADSLSRFGVTVDVQAHPVSYRWEFGDGTEKLTDSPGRPYPQRSEITHTYDRSSAQFAQGFAVSVTVDFDVRWRTDGGRWRALPGISRTSERFYPVAESQAVNSDG